VDTSVAVVTAIYLMTRFPHNSTDTTLYPNPLQLLRQRLHMVLGYLYHKMYYYSFLTPDIAFLASLLLYSNSNLFSIYFVTPCNDGFVQNYTVGLQYQLQSAINTNIIYYSH